MPVHDWARVPDDVFHDFHLAWVTHLSSAINDGLQPETHYALIERHAGKGMPECLLATADPLPASEAPYSLLRRTIAIRLCADHRVVALVEILSPGNKSTASNWKEFADKITAAIDMGIHVLVIDLVPPNPHIPQGILSAFWEAFGPEMHATIPGDKPLLVVSFASHLLSDAYGWPLAVGDRVPEVFLVLAENEQVIVALEDSYLQAYRGMPEFWRDVIEGRREAS